jgi:hypothetical protein
MSIAGAFVRLIGYYTRSVTEVAALITANSQFAVAITAQLLTFPPNIRLFGIGLRADRYIFSRSHRHRASDKP